MLKEIGDSVRKHGIVVHSPKPPKPDDDINSEDLLPQQRRASATDIKKVVYVRATAKGSEAKNPLLRKKGSPGSPNPEL